MIVIKLPNPSSRNMALGLTQPLTEMITRNLPGGKARPFVSRLPRKYMSPVILQIYRPLFPVTI
jgi:hypothetical protein